MGEDGGRERGGGGGDLCSVARMLPTSLRLCSETGATEGSHASLGHPGCQGRSLGTKQAPGPAAEPAFLSCAARGRVTPQHRPPGGSSQNYRPGQREK